MKNFHLNSVLYMIKALKKFLANLDENPRRPYRKIIDKVERVRYCISINILKLFGIFAYFILVGFKPLSVDIVGRHPLPDWITGDTEFIEAQFGGKPLGLITYVSNHSSGDKCQRTGETRQNVFVIPLDPYTGLPVNRDQAKWVGSDECGIPKYSDAEFGLDAVGQPLLAYTSETGVQLVQIYGESWEDAVSINQKIPYSDDWQVSAEPLSIGFPELQITAITHSNLPMIAANTNSLWYSISIDHDKKIDEIKKITIFSEIFAEEERTLFRSMLHPKDPTRFIRISKSGIYEFSNQGKDIEIIYNRTPQFPQPWNMPANECIKFGLQNVSQNEPCIAIVFSEYNKELSKSFLVVMAKHSKGHWIEILRVPYRKAGHPRINVTVVDHLDPPKSVILATGDSASKLYFLDGSSFLLDKNVHLRGSETLYFSESNLLGVYYKDAIFKQLLVTMVHIY